MKEGRELDSLIAEKVMGWHIEPSSNPVSFPGGAIWSPQWWCDGLNERKRRDVNFHPSSNIADAWEVVEKLVADGKVFIVKGDGLRDGTFNPAWTVLCDGSPRTDATTAPLAICLAALKAVGVEVTE